MFAGDKVSISGQTWEPKAGEYLHIKLPCGRLLEFEYTQDTVSVCIEGLIQKESYVLFAEELNPPDFVWEVSSPKALIRDL